MRTPLALRLTEGNITADLYACKTKNGQNDPKMALWGNYRPLIENYRTPSIKVRQKTPIDVFCRNFIPICAVTKKCEFVAPTPKTCTFWPPFCAPLAQGAKILRLEIWVKSTYACKILSGSVKVC